MHPLATVALAAAASNGVGSHFGDLKRSFRELVQNDPMDAVVVTVLGGSYLFWIAERDVNPKCKTYMEALVFISTCLSVGYSDIFAKTPTGQAIATAVMTIGPKLSGSIFDTPAPEQKPDPTMEKIATTLDAILLELRNKK